MENGYRISIKGPNLSPLSTGDLVSWTYDFHREVGRVKPHKSAVSVRGTFDPRGHHSAVCL